MHKKKITWRHRVGGLANQTEFKETEIRTAEMKAGADFEKKSSNLIFRGVSRLD